MTKLSNCSATLDSRSISSMSKSQAAVKRSPKFAVPSFPTTRSLAVGNPWVQFCPLATFRLRHLLSAADISLSSFRKASGTSAESWLAAPHFGGTQVPTNGDFRRQNGIAAFKYLTYRSADSRMPELGPRGNTPTTSANFPPNTSRPNRWDDNSASHATHPSKGISYAI